jgi:hypothetical protein
MFRWSGFVRLWMVLSAAWAIFVYWTFWKSCLVDPQSGDVLCHTGFVSRGAPVLEHPARFAIADWFMWIARAAAPPFVSAVIALLIRNAANRYSAKKVARRS